MWTIGERVIAGIVEGCVQAGCALVGGETAEMPGMYHGEDYDLAGFCVGVVEKDRIIDGSKTAAGDVVLGLPSSGPHSNGFSLIRKILEVSGTDPATPGRGRRAHRAAAGTDPHLREAAAAGSSSEIAVHGLAHITGGGLLDNIPRVLPEGLEVVLERRAWSTRPGVRVAPARRPRRRRGDVSGIQLRDRHDGARRRAGRRPGDRRCFERQGSRRRSSARYARARAE